MNEAEVAAMMAEQNKLISDAEVKNVVQRTEVNLVAESKLQE